jgi:hypothetical protein
MTDKRKGRNTRKKEDKKTFPLFVIREHRKSMGQGFSLALFYD